MFKIVFDTLQKLSMQKEQNKGKKTLNVLNIRFIYFTSYYDLLFHVLFSYVT